MRKAIGWMGAAVAAAALGGCTLQPTRVRAASVPELATAEALVDAFYSFDPAPLRAALGDAQGASAILYYQGWAEGGNYVVLNRQRCRFEKADEVRCDITVKDDLIPTLGGTFDVTDSFHVSFKDGSIAAVKTSSNDPPELKEAMQWLERERPAIMAGPCRGFFAGGPTPQACIRAVVQGIREWRAKRPG